MKTLLAAKLLGASIPLGVLTATAQLREVVPVPATEIRDTNHLDRAASPGPVEGILKLSNAGVSRDVIKAYIDTIPRYTPTPEDLIELKRHAVPDELTVALLKRSGELRTQAAKGPLSPSVGLQSAVLGRPPFLDPESYNYFQYYYLFPRTLAAANERLGMYSAPGFNGYYPPYWGGSQAFRRFY